MRKSFIGIIFLFFVGINFNINAATLETPLQVCFTPGGNCTADIVNVINQAHKSLLIQAYQFTSPPIARAVVDAKNRGVDVKIILDKTQYSDKKYSSAQFFANEGVPVWIDYRPHIAHNKIMIIDNQIVITGSFNFTRNAQDHNAENLLIIKSPQLASIYQNNWDNRLAASYTLQQYIDYKTLKPSKKSKESVHNHRHYREIE